MKTELKIGETYTCYYTRFPREVVYLKGKLVRFEGTENEIAILSTKRMKNLMMPTKELAEINS